MTNIMLGIPEAIMNATVYVDRVRRTPDGGGEDEYSGKYMDLVVNRALIAMQAIDKYKSPNMSTACLAKDGYWYVTVNWWGLG